MKDSKKKTLTRHSHVWHWYIHCSPLLNTTWFNSWCWQDSFGSHWGQHISRPLPRRQVEQLHGFVSHDITPLLHVQNLHGWFAGFTISPFEISDRSNIQPKHEAKPLSVSNYIYGCRKCCFWKIVYVLIRHERSSAEQWHSKPPSVLTHSADEWQLCVLW